MLGSLTRTDADLLSRAAQAVEVERDLEQLRELQRNNPLTPTHVLRNQQRSRRKGWADLAAVSQRSLDSSASSGSQTSSASKHIHFNNLVEQYIIVEAKYDEEDSPSIDDESEDEGLFMASSRLARASHHSTIAKLPATRLRSQDEPSCHPTQSGLEVGLYSGSQNHLTGSSGFYYQEGSGFSSAGPTARHTLNPVTSTIYYLMTFSMMTVSLHMVLQHRHGSQAISS